MGASNKTPSLELGQYQAGDRPSFLGTYNSDMKTLDNFAEEMKSKISTEEEKTNEFTEQIKSLSESQVSTADTVTELLELTADVGTFNAKIQKNETNITNLGDSVDNLIATTNSLKTGVSKNSGDITNLDKSLGVFGTTLSGHSSAITNLDNTTTKLNSQIETILASTTNNKKIQYFIGDFSKYTHSLNGINITKEMDIIFMKNSPITGQFIMFSWHGVLTDSSTTDVHSQARNFTYYDVGAKTLLTEFYSANFKLQVGSLGEVKASRLLNAPYDSSKANGIVFPNMTETSKPYEASTTEFNCAVLFIQ